jgi:hypothetical protein
MNPFDLVLAGITATAVATFIALHSLLRTDAS